MGSDIQKVAERARSVLNLAAARLGEEFYYQSLPLCVIDAVFSINARYVGVRRVVTRYCKAFQLTEIRSTPKLPAREAQETVSSFCKRAEERGPEAMAETVFDNRCRTSPRSGILKSEAAYRFARVLRSHCVECFQDIPEAMQNPDLEADVRRIPGQRSGISLSYFWMLAGSDDSIKPDRRILRFVADTLDRSVTVGETRSLIQGAARVLRTEFPNMTPRLFDHTIWDFEQSQSSAKQRCGA